MNIMNDFITAIKNSKKLLKSLAILSMLKNFNSCYFPMALKDTLSTGGGSVLGLVIVDVHPGAGLLGIGRKMLQLVAD
ncbi:CLUMA_CG020129, isoform A [Clunio marinus]|uniref:CLUMA_CG020129, isoform A n=1 Tax=Clunio marinus TaxID=568069 RepID=A0A1J1J6M4_9DIPT|nr:CLUMA_CG020129, isoform A [Clunio marinus]